MSYYKMNLTQPATAGVTWGSGNINTNSSQPAFCAYPSGDIANVTGDGTYYTCVLNTKAFDQGSNFNTSTGVYTCPTTGLYQFDVSISGFNFSAGHNGYQVMLTKNSGTYIIFSQVNPFVVQPGSTVVTLSGSFILNMTAGDTMSAVLYVGGSTKTVYMQGFLVNTRFSGFLVC